jgi:mannose-6-phosphate isomerase-like protein (cupin superfamily)
MNMTSANRNEVKYVVKEDEVRWLYFKTISPQAWPRDKCRSKVLISDETGSKDLHLGVGELDPGEKHILHHHEKESEFYYVLEGRAKVIVDDLEIDATKGTAIYIPAGAKHAIVTEGNKCFRFLYGFNYPSIGITWDE